MLCGVILLLLQLSKTMLIVLLCNALMSDVELKCFFLFCSCDECLYDVYGYSSILEFEKNVYIYTCINYIIIAISSMHPEKELYKSMIRSLRDYTVL